MFVFFLLNKDRFYALFSARPVTDSDGIQSTQEDAAPQMNACPILGGDVAEYHASPSPMPPQCISTTGSGSTGKGAAMTHMQVLNTLWLKAEETWCTLET